MGSCLNAAPKSSAFNGNFDWWATFEVSKMEKANEMLTIKWNDTRKTIQHNPASKPEHYPFLCCLNLEKGPSGYSSRFGRGETGASWCLTPRLAIFPQEIMIQQEITENLLVSRNRHADFRQTNRLDLCWVPGKTPDSCWQPLWPWSTLQFCSKNFQGVMLPLCPNFLGFFIFFCCWHSEWATCLASKMADTWIQLCLYFSDSSMMRTCRILISEKMQFMLQSESTLTHCFLKCADSYNSLSAWPEQHLQRSCTCQSRPQLTAVTP